MVYLSEFDAIIVIFPFSIISCRISGDIFSGAQCIAIFSCANKLVSILLQLQLIFSTLLYIPGYSKISGHNIPKESLAWTMKSFRISGHIFSGAQCIAILSCANKLVSILLQLQLPLYTLSYIPGYSKISGHSQGQ